MQPPKENIRPRAHREKFHGVPTIADVAKVAGVGTATASRVVNQSPLVRPETRRLVEEAIVKVGYLPPAPEKRLRPKIREKMGSMNTVAIVLPENIGFQWISDFAPVYAYALAGVESALRRHGINCIVHQLAPEGENRKGNPIPKVDGCLLLSEPARAATYQWITNRPCVTFMGKILGGQWCDRVTYNDVRCGELAAEYMHNVSVAHAVAITTRDPLLFNLRTAAFVAEAGRLGLEAECVFLEGLLVRGANVHSTDESKMEVLLRKLLEGKQQPKGIFAEDILLPSIYRQLQKMGISPGREVRVVGCNNERFFLNGLDPSPPVVDLHARTIGENAVEHLLWRARHPGAKTVAVLVEPSLLIP